jgi:predicted outer membrane repeat protein
MFACRLFVLVIVGCADAASNCSDKPITIRISSTVALAQLIEAALCPGAIVNANWQGAYNLTETIIVGNGTTLTVAGTTDTAVMDGNGNTQLFDVWGELNLSNMTLKDGFAERGGAVRVNEGSSMTASNCVFVENRASISGGAINGRNESTLTVKSCAFCNNIAGSVGGAILSFEDSTLSISTSIFRNNSAVDNGGAIYLSPNAICSVDKCSFTENNAGGLGGALQLDGSIAAVTNSNFEGNSARLGGAIYTQTPLKVTNTAFTRNIASGTIDYSSVTGDVADKARAVGSGGAIYCDNNTFLELFDSNFLDNTAFEFGGAIFTNEVNSTIVVLIEECNFVGGSANFGGSVYANINSLLAITRSSFTNSSAENQGGAVYTDGIVSVNDSLFSSNSVRALASVGGALHASFGTYVNISNTQFQYNSAGGYGGAVHVDKNNSAMFIYNSTFWYNEANFGGAVYSQADLGAVIELSTFKGNNAVKGRAITVAVFGEVSSGGGGAVAVEGTGSLALNFVLFENNAAVTGGGAVYVSIGSKIVVQNCTYNMNSALAGGGAIASSATSNVDLYSTVFSGTSSRCSAMCTFSVSREHSPTCPRY